MSELKQTVTKVTKVRNKVVKPAVIKSPKYFDREMQESYSSIKELKLEIVDCGVVDLMIDTIDDVYFRIEDTEFCCGLLELGEIHCSKGIPIKELASVLDRAVECVSENKNTLIINTNGKDASIIFEKALAKCKYWTLVKTFKNGNSGNTIKMWISNND